MSYQVLARKWRPQVFEDVVGQGHITKTLQNAISSNRLAHAFLFSGPRGVGKTTTARILAKALNCTNGPTPHPCGTCDSCVETAAGTAVDVIEIDGASNRGIEHIRELRETVKYAPVGGKHKVYVIDEVHMLTNEAFNALLKTLEEPPPHVIFIFATTEPQKIPATIHSRCQRYGFKRVSLQETVDRLRTIAAAEGISISDPGLTMIARAAEGSMRDSQSLLDQAVSFSGTTVTDRDLQTVLGAVSLEVLRAFTSALLERNTSALLQLVETLIEQGQDMRQFLAGAVEHVRNLIVARTSQDPSRIIELPVADLEAVKAQAAPVDVERLLLLFDNLSRTLEEIRRSPHQRFTLEVGLVKACSIGPLQPLADVLDHLRALEEQIGTGTVPMSSPDRIAERPASFPVPAQGAAPRASSRGSGGSDPWQQVITVLKQKRPGLATPLLSSSVLERSENALTIGIKGTAFQMEMLEKKENRELIERTLQEISGRALGVSFRLVPAEKHKPARSAPPKPGPADPQQDPFHQDVLNIFNGKVIDAGEPGDE